MKTVEYYFDFSCPYAYLGTLAIEKLVQRHGARLVWRPMLLGGVFRARDTPQKLFSELPPAKTAHNAADMVRWAEHFGVTLTVPSDHPFRTVRALRALLASPRSAWPEIIHAIYAAYWNRHEDIADPGVLRVVLERTPLSSEAVGRALDANDDDDIKAELRQRTDEAIARDVFGAPAVFVSGDDIVEPYFFWGQDRLHMVESVLQGWRPEDKETAAFDYPTIVDAGVQLQQQRQHPAPATAPVVEFWYDFSSPFAYLGFTQIEKLAAETGAKVDWRPMLLGAVFQAIETPMVPLQAMSDAKRKYYAADLHRWAAFWQVPFRFNTTFPLRSVKALRLALLAGERIASLNAALFRAAWVESRNIDDDEVLQDVLTTAGFDALEMLARTQEPAVKQRLVDNTAEAVTKGVFGAPTCIVDGKYLFWGQDRLALVKAVLRGWSPSR